LLKEKKINLNTLSQINKIDSNECVKIENLIKDFSNKTFEEKKEILKKVKQ